MVRCAIDSVIAMGTFQVGNVTHLLILSDISANPALLGFVL